MSPPTPGSAFRMRSPSLQSKSREAARGDVRNLTPLADRTAGAPPASPLHARLLNLIFTEFVELHGDRIFGDDQAIVGGLARLDGQPVMVIGHQKGRDTKENVRRNFGMPQPEGYRKALRLMQLAERSAAADHLHRHAGRLPGHRRRGARPGRGHRA